MKREIRHRMRATLAGMAPQTQAAKSRRAREAIVHLPEFRDARVVMIYLEIPHEAAAAELALPAWQDDKTVLVPRVVPDRQRMDAVPIRSLDAGIARTCGNLREPTNGDPWPVENIDLIVAPGLAFDRRGNRLGRGGGYYDRFLALPGVRAVTCALAFAEQIVDHVPTGAHDRAMDLIVTDAEVLRFDARSTRRKQPTAG